MSIHEYIFVTISIVYGLAITRMLTRVLGLLRTPPSDGYSLSLWLWPAGIVVSLIWFIWIGFSLQGLDNPGYGLFLYLLLTTVCIFGAAEFSLPTGREADAASDARCIRISALFMLAYLLLVYSGYVATAGGAPGDVILPAAVGLLLLIFTLVRPDLLRWSAPLYLAYALLFHSPLQRLAGLSG